MSEINFRNLKLKSHEEYLICRTCFDLIFKVKRKVEKGERNDEMTCESKSKALLSINLNAENVNGMTHFDEYTTIRYIRVV